jgi:hypothetical protein
VPVPLATVKVIPAKVAWAGTAFSSPKPKVAIATSDIRLRFVVMDILFEFPFFSRYQEFPSNGS